MKNLKQTPNNDELLELYALFKQATVGDVNTGMWQVMNSWNSLKYVKKQKILITKA